MKKTIPAALAVLALAAAAGSTACAANASSHENDAIVDLAMARITVGSPPLAAARSRRA